MKRTIRNLSSDMLKDIVESLNDDHDKHATLVFEMALVELEARMNETEFVAFCDSL